MKQSVTSLGIVMLLASSSHGAVLWMQFEGGGNEVTLHPSESVNVEIWLNLVEGETITGLSYGNWPTVPDTAESAYPRSWYDLYGPGVEGLEQGVVDALPSGWSSNGSRTRVALGSYSHEEAQFVNIFAQGWDDILVGPGSFHIANQPVYHNSITIAQSQYFNGQVNDDFYDADKGKYFYPIMFGGDPVHGWGINLSDMWGGDVAFNPNYVAAGYSGYYTWGQGASAISGRGWSLADNPLKVFNNPEPASLALLLVGGLACLRRRPGS